MRRLCLLLCLAIAAPAEAGKLYACRDAEGNVAFVDRACPSGGERRELSLPAAEESKRAVADSDSKEIAAWAAASRARLPASLGGSVSSGDSSGKPARRSRPDDDGRCAKARAAKSTAERDRSFSMSFDERRRLSDAEIEACGLR